MNRSRSLPPCTLLCTLLCATSFALADGWKADPVWHDGLVEKAVYSASRVVYGKPRSYELVIFTNKEQHDRATWTKANTSQDTVEVFKHNQVEVIPTPNYQYKYVTTSHLTVDGLELTRLDCSSQEFCGTSFKQFLRSGRDRWDYWSFSYMPEAGRVSGAVRASGAVVPQDALPLWLRDYDFRSRPELRFTLLPSQRNNVATPYAPVPARVRYAGEEDGSHKLEVYVEPSASIAKDPSRGVDGMALAGTYWMASDRLHVMTRFLGADGQRYELKGVDRVDYWTRKE